MMTEAERMALARAEERAERLDQWIRTQEADRMERLKTQEKWADRAAFIGIWGALAWLNSQPPVDWNNVSTGQGIFICLVGGFGCLIVLVLWLSIVVEAFAPGFIDQLLK